MAGAAPHHPHYADNVSAFPMEGGCSCGRVRYRLERPPLIVHCCHCTGCQRETGSAFCVNALLEDDAVTGLPSAPPSLPACPSRPDDFPACGPPLEPSPGNMIHGAGPVASSGSDSGSGPGSSKVVEPLVITVPSESGLGQNVARCQACGSMVWSCYAGSGPVLRYLRVGTLDRPWLVAPDVHIFTRSKRDFVTLTDGKPAFEAFYKNRRDVYRKEALERFDVLLPAIKEWRAKAKHGSKI